MSAEKLVVNSVEIKATIFDYKQTLGIGNVVTGRAVNSNPRPGLVPTLRWLNNLGVQIGVVSSGTEVSTRIMLDAAGAGQYVKPGYIFGEDSTRKVPKTVIKTQKVKGWRGLRGVTEEVPVTTYVDKYFYPKPHPDTIHFLLKEMGLTSEPQSVLYVGDDPYYDGQCAVDAGVQFALIPSMFSDGSINLLHFMQGLK